MPGPIPARTSRGFVPNSRSIAFSAATATPACVPRHPACASPTAAWIGIPQDDREAVGVRREQPDSPPVGDQGVDVVDDRRRRINACDVGAVDGARDCQRVGAVQLEDARELIAGFASPRPGRSRGSDRPSRAAWSRTRGSASARRPAPARAGRLGSSSRVKDYESPIYRWSIRLCNATPSVFDQRHPGRLLRSS